VIVRNEEETGVIGQWHLQVIITFLRAVKEAMILGAKVAGY